MLLVRLISLNSLGINQIHVFILKQVSSSGGLEFGTLLITSVEPFINVFRITPCLKMCLFLKFLNYGPFLASFLIIIFPFSWYIVKLQLIDFTLVNGDRNQKRRRRKCSITR